LKQNEAAMTSPENVMECKTILLPNDLTVNYRESGAGQKEAVIFLHGYADSWRSYERILRLFPSKYRCLAMDLRGHGESSKPDCCYKMMDFADDIRLFQDAVGITKSTLIGHSMGSFIAQIFAADYPERVEKLILISSSSRAKENSILIEIQDDIMSLQDPVAESFIEDFQTPSLPVPDEFMQSIIAESKKIPARIWKTVFRELLSADNSSLLSRIGAKTLILWGCKDVIFKKEDQDIISSKIKNSEFIAYEAGHALHWELPERVVRDIAQFLESGR
jgi:non-heme chloroperoxidase